MSRDISLSLARMAFDPARRDYRFFHTRHGPFERIKSFITREVWSPIAFLGGERVRAAFVSTDLVALDFDSGEWTVADARDHYSRLGVSVLIGTTQSHQREKVSGSSGKVSPPCDRFRVVLAAERCTSRDSYEYTMRQLAADTPCDPSCSDGARYFNPCREVVYELLVDGELSWLPAPERRPRASFDGSKGEMAWWARDLLNLGCETGGRHRACYKLGAELHRCGFTESEIVSKVMRGPLAAIGEADARRAVANGINAAAKDMGDWT